MPKLDQKGIAPIFLLITIGIISVVVISATFSFKNLTFQALFPKIPSNASTNKNIHLALITNNNLPTNDKSSEEGIIEYVWGADSGGWNAKNIPAQGSLHTYYTLFNANPRNCFPLGYWLYRFPDQIFYKDYRNIVYMSPSSSNYNLMLDFKNNNLQDNLLRFVYKAIDAYPGIGAGGGYQGVAFDNTYTANVPQVKGVYTTLGQISSSVSSGSTTLSIRLNSGVSLLSSGDIRIGTVKLLNPSKNIDSCSQVADWQLQAEHLSYSSIQNNGDGTKTLTLTSPLSQSHEIGESLAIWQQRYSGNIIDSNYRSDFIAAFKQVKDKIKNYAVSKGINFSITINNAPNYPYDPNSWGDLWPDTDFVLDEYGFTGLGYGKNNVCGVGHTNYLTSSSVTIDKNHDLAGIGYQVVNGWLTKMQKLQSLLRLGKGLVLINLLPYSIDSANPPQRADTQWILANYFLLKNDSTYLSLITGRVGSSTGSCGASQYGGPVITLPEYNAQIGIPLADFYSSQGVYMRDFSNGLSIVNPSSVSLSISLSTNKYKDLYGNIVNNYSMPPTSGLILVYSIALPTPTLTPRPTQTPTARPTITPTSNPSSTPNPSPKPGDLNGDGVVNVIDYGIFVGDFPSQNLRSDIDHDGRVTVIDYGIFVANFGK